MFVSQRRDFLGYIGTGALGAMAGYYVGAQELLGIQSSVTGRPDDDSDRGSNNNVGGTTETEETNQNQNTSQADIFDDFEDTSQLKWEVTEGTRSDLTFADEAVHGSHSLYFKQSSNQVVLRRGLSEPTQVSFFSFWFKYRSQRDNNFRVSLFDGNNNKLIEIREFGQTVHYKNRGGGGVTSEPVGSIEQDTWVQVVLSRIDFGSQTLDVEVRDATGETIGSATGIGFWNPVEHVDNVRIVDGLRSRSGQPGAADPLWIDYMRLDGAPSAQPSNLYADFEDGDLDNPEWSAVGRGSMGLVPENEIGIANDGHDSQHSLYLDQGGSISNFGAESTLANPVSPTQISFWIKPTNADQYTKNDFSLKNDGTVGIDFINHIQNDGLYFRFGETNDEKDRQRVRDGAIDPDTERFVEVRMEQINWQSGTIGEVYVDGDLTTRDAPFRNTVPGFDTVSFGAIGGGGTVFLIDDIGWL
jgi:hypothetical protein